MKISLLFMLCEMLCLIKLAQSDLRESSVEDTATLKFMAQLRFYGKMCECLCLCAQGIDRLS